MYPPPTTCQSNLGAPETRQNETHSAGVMLSPASPVTVARTARTSVKTTLQLLKDRQRSFGTPRLSAWRRFVKFRTSTLNSEPLLALFRGSRRARPGPTAARRGHRSGRDTGGAGAAVEPVTEDGLSNGAERPSGTGMCPSSG